MINKNFYDGVIVPNLLVLLAALVLIPACANLPTAQQINLAANATLLEREADVAREVLQRIPFSDTERVLIDDAMARLGVVERRLQTNGAERLLVEVLTARETLDTIAGAYLQIEAAYGAYRMRTETPLDPTLAAYDQSAKLVYQGVLDVIDQTDDQIDLKVVTPYLSTLLRLAVVLV